MSNLVLLADDSSTIEKVISITLANEPIELEVAKTHDELREKLKNKSYSLVLLDFGLSNDQDGYQVCTEIKKQHTELPVLIMFGTFDTVDEAKMMECKGNDKIVKPFDSTEFVEICRDLIGRPEDDEKSTNDENLFKEMASKFNTLFGAEEEGDQKTSNEIKVNSEDSSDQDWEVKEEVQTFGQDSFQEVGDFTKDLDPTKELSDWGIEIPGKINAQNSTDDEFINVPGVISKNNILGEEIDTAFEEMSTTPSGEDEDIEFDEDTASLFPDDNDLEYPQIDLSSDKKLMNPYTEQESSEEDKESEEFSEEQADFSNLNLTSKLISLDELNEDDEDDKDDKKEKNVKEEKPAAQKEIILEKEIEQERDREEFWEVDDAKEDEQTKPALTLDEDQFLQSLGEKTDLNIKQPDFNKNTNQSTNERIKESFQEKDLEALALKIEESLTEKLEEIVEKTVRKILKESSEKVAWEIIPDLAENLIREELKNISESIESHDLES